MIALFNFTPSHCPRCGVELGNWDTYGRQDFFAGCAHTCRGCGLHYAYAPGEKILETAAATGDMGRYVTASEVEG
jgi:hypothetical protein